MQNKYLENISESIFLFFLDTGGSDSGRRFGGRLTGVTLSSLSEKLACTGSGKLSVGFPSGKC
jgi:hypothetical protein